MNKRAEGAVLMLGLVAAIAWLASYSWMLGAVIPMQNLEYRVSPWLVSEIVAVVVGAVAVLVALAVSRKGAPWSARSRTGAILGGGAAVLSLLSLAAA